MPKTKVTHKTFKLTTKKSKSNIGLIALGILAVIIIASSFIYSTIASINRPSVVSSMLITPTLRKCENVKTFSLNNNCGSSYYQTAIFMCGNSKAVRKIGTKSLRQMETCKSYTSLYSDAQSICRSTCPIETPVPSTKPSPVASPIASCKPRPACLDAKPRACVLPVTEDMCSPQPILSPTPIPHIRVKR